MYRQKRQQQSCRPILRMSVIRMWTNFGFASFVMLVPSSCRPLLMKYYQPLLGKTTVICSLPPPDNEHQWSFNSVRSCIWVTMASRRSSGFTGVCYAPIIHTAFIRLYTATYLLFQLTLSSQTQCLILFKNMVLPLCLIRQRGLFVLLCLGSPTGSDVPGYPASNRLNDGQIQKYLKDVSKTPPIVELYQITESVDNPLVCILRLYWSPQTHTRCIAVNALGM